MKKILVALDGSPHERDVLAAAVSLAQRLGGELLLFHAVSLPVEVPWAALSVAPDRVGELLLDEAVTHVRTLLQGLPAGVVAETLVGLGTPWRAVCDAARTHAVDLVVIGTHGFDGVDRLIGTTAAKIVNHAPCSVLVARPPA
jgi:nucleotide-binding universal stress UspA family protein